MAQQATLVARAAELAAFARALLALLRLSARRALTAVARDVACASTREALHLLVLPALLRHMTSLAAVEALRIR
eukprot:10845223-Heterocapsa_arctica.AAC.1